jgi:hypothetical protein
MVRFYCGALRLVRNKTLSFPYTGKTKTSRHKNTLTAPAFGSSCLNLAPRCLNPAPRCLNPEPRCLNPEPRCLNPAPRCLNPAPRCLNPAPRCLNPKLGCLNFKLGCLNFKLGCLNFTPVCINFRMPCLNFGAGRGRGAPLPSLGYTASLPPPKVSHSLCEAMASGVLRSKTPCSTPQRGVEPAPLVPPWQMGV